MLNSFKCPFLASSLETGAQGLGFGPDKNDDLPSLLKETSLTDAQKIYRSDQRKVNSSITGKALFSSYYILYSL